MLPILRSFVRAKSGGRMKACPRMPLLWVLVLCLCPSCGGKMKGLPKPASSGLPYEVLVVADPQVWESPAGRTLYKVLDADVPGLPQAEPSFHIMHAASQDFDAVLRLARNILVLDVDSAKHAQASSCCERDVYAASQMVVTVQAPDEVSLATVVEKEAVSWARLFTQAERERRMDWLVDNHSVQVERQVKEQFACKVWVPAELAFGKTGRDFFWASTRAVTEDRNFVIYTYPYTGTDVFTKARFIQKRDSVMRKNIPGARAGMYMMTDSLRTGVRLLATGGDTLLEARGLWRVKGDFMGGPFVSHVRVDKAGGRVVVCEIFVYAPGRPKRNLTRLMEASLHTLRLPDDADKEENKKQL